MEKKQNEEETVHHVLARSYLVYFMASLAGLFVDGFVSIPFTVPFGNAIAIGFLGAGPLLIFWAQYTSWRCSLHDHSAAYFHHGPYRFLRNPTHLGVLMLATGYSLIAGSAVFFLATLVGFLVSNVFFKRYEAISENKYGDYYLSYKSRTPKI